MALSDVIKKGAGAPTAGDLIEGGIGISVTNAAPRIYTKDDAGNVVNLVTKGYDNDLIARTADLTNKTLVSSTNDIHADAVHNLVYNVSGTGIVKGQAVAFSSYDGAANELRVELADGITKPAIGVAHEDIADTASGLMISMGIIKGYNTSAYTAGTILYVNPASPGNFTSTDPGIADLDNAMVQPIAFVMRVHATNGALLINAGYPKQVSSDVRYDPTISGLTAETVKAALDEIDGNLDTHDPATTGVHGVTGTVVGTSDTQTLTNKTLDIDSNTLFNVEVDNFKATAIVTATEGLASSDNDTSLPTTAATKVYSDDVALALSIALG